jgi:hypothetical protein
MRVFENRILRRIYWPKTVDVAENWRKMHNEELHNNHLIIIIIIILIIMIIM